jgi:hypothetical protein
LLYGISKGPESSGNLESSSASELSLGQQDLRLEWAMKYPVSWSCSTRHLETMRNYSTPFKLFCLSDIISCSEIDHSPAIVLPTIHAFPCIGLPLFWVSVSHGEPTSLCPLFCRNSAPTSLDPKSYWRADIYRSLSGDKVFRAVLARGIGIGLRKYVSQEVLILQSSSPSKKGALSFAQDRRATKLPIFQPQISRRWALSMSSSIPSSRLHAETECSLD